MSMILDTSLVTGTVFSTGVILGHGDERSTEKPHRHRISLDRVDLYVLFGGNRTTLLEEVMISLP